MARLLPEMEWPRLKAPSDVYHRKSPNLIAEEIFCFSVTEVQLLKEVELLRRLPRRK
jgi:hypothetical protein